MDFAHEAVTALGIFVLALIIVVAFVDGFLEHDHQSIGKGLAWWTGRHPLMVFGFVFFYGFLLAHLFTKF